MRPPRHRIDWQVAQGLLSAIEPTPAEVAAAAGALAEAYSHPRNAPMMGHDQIFSPDDGIGHIEELRDEGGHPFLLWHDGALAGDADLRGIGDGRAEFALLVAEPAAQGRGLGTRFAIMIHAFAFRTLGLEQVHVAIVPENQPSLRLFARLGYHTDDSPVARAYVEDPGEVSMSIRRADFERGHAKALAEIRIHFRT